MRVVVMPAAPYMPSLIYIYMGPVCMEKPWSLGLPVALGDSAKVQAPDDGELMQALEGRHDLVAVPGVGEGADCGQ